MYVILEKILEVPCPGEFHTFVLGNPVACHGVSLGPEEDRIRMGGLPVIDKSLFAFNLYIVDGHVELYLKKEFLYK